MQWSNLKWLSQQPEIVSHLMCRVVNGQLGSEGLPRGLVRLVIPTDPLTHWPLACHKCGEMEAQLGVGKHVLPCHS